MGHDVQTDELLSAYLADDIAPDERATVERRLARDHEFRERLTDLQALVELLRQGERPVTAEMLADFKRRIEHHLGAPAGRAVFAHLVSCSITGDLTATERSVLAIYLTRHPAARNEVVSLKAMSRFLKKAERQVSPQAAQKLTQRLSAKIPAAALAAVLPQATETVSLQLQGAAAGRSTVRVFVAQENLWPRRVRRSAAALAALIAMSVGTMYGLRTMFKTKSEPGIVDEQNPRASKKFDLRDGSQDERVAMNEITGDGHGAQGSAPGVQSREVPPVPPADGFLNPPDEVVPPNDARDTIKQPRTPNHGVPTIDNGINPNKANRTEPPDEPKRNRLDEPGTPTPEPRYPQPQQVDPNPNGRAPSVIPGNGNVIPPVQTPNNPTQPNQQNTPTPATPKVAADPLAPVDNKLVVAVIRDGLVQASTAAGAQTVQVNDQLPSGTDIMTDNARLALVGPLNSRLWINRHSSLHIDLNGANMTVQLNKGEIAYRAPMDGNLTVNNAGGVQIADATGMVDVNADPTANTVVAAVIDKTVNLVQKGNKKVVRKQTKVTVKTETNDTTIVAFSDHPDEWHSDMVVPGDNPDGTPLVPFNDRGKGRSKK